MPKTAAGRSILTVNLAGETDFLFARQRAKQIAKLLGFETQDQTRIATAVSEIARNAFEYAAGGAVEYFLDSADQHGGGPRFRVTVTDRGKGIPHLDDIWAGTYKSPTGMGIGMIGTRRLMDDLEVQTGPGGTKVSLAKNLPRGVALPEEGWLVKALARDMSGAQRGQTDPIHEQNRELLTLLGELRTREAELQSLNAELEETNRGVLVLYAELEDKAQAVQQASEMKQRFLSGVTHELRTPLNSIVSLARLMLSHTDGPLNAEQEKQLHFMLRSAGHLTEMVNDLLDLAKIEAGKSSTNLTDFTVADLYAGLRGMFRSLATNPEVRLIFEIPEETILLRSDEGKLAQILRNFISNALKFTQAGTVTVSAAPMPSAGPQAIRFSVADTGIGIAPEHHDLVMQEWGQVLNGFSGSKGSGLGLPLSRSLAELLGGTVEFTSALGQGSTFHVTLPAMALAEPPASTDPAYVLMIDDDEVSRYLLRRTLSGLTTAPVEDAASGEAGLEAIRKRTPTLLFLDLVMPGMSGLEVARRLRADEQTAALPIVLYTSQTLTETERRTFNALDLTVIGKGTVGRNGSEDQRMQIERVLLGVGLSNMHQGGTA